MTMTIISVPLFTCHSCDQPKSLSDFRADARYVSGHENRCKDCKADTNAQGRERVREQVFAHYGRMCRCCGSTENLTIDHPGGDGREHRITLFRNPRQAGWPFYYWLRRNNFPPGYQVLCGSCNTSKYRSGTCRMHGASLGS